jgi:DNA-binding NarL/FixJ family response regulator
MGGHATSRRTVAIQPPQCRHRRVAGKQERADSRVEQRVTTPRARADSCLKTSTLASCSTASGSSPQETLIAPWITRRLITEFAARPDPREPPVAVADLTEREGEILRLVARGLTNAEIAGRLAISPLTAKTHVSRILRKLGCRDRAQLVTIAYETGLLAAVDATEGD